MFFDSKIEQMDRAEMRALQLERLKKIVKCAYDRVPFYKNKFDAIGLKPEDIQTLEDIKKIPYTTKADLRDNYPYGLLAVPMDDIVRVHASSGTSGKPTVVAYTKNDLDMWSDCVARLIVAAGGRKSDVVQISFGYGLFTGALGLHQGWEKVGASVIPASSGNTERQVMLMKDLGATALVATPSYGLYISEVMERMGLKKEDFKLRIGLFGSEASSPEMHQELQNKLGVFPTDNYGLSEIIGPGVSGECEFKCGMHINEDHFIAEIIDPNTGEVLPEGTKGELVFTCLDKEAFPVLRYRTRDICVLSSEPCSCGRTHIRMQKPMGRSDDMMIIRGVNVFPSQIEAVLLKKGYSPNYMIEVGRKNNSDTLDVFVELTPEQFADTVREISAMERSLESAIHTMIGISPKVRLVAPKTIARSEGKAVRVVDKRKLHD